MSRTLAILFPIALLFSLAIGCGIMIQVVQGPAETRDEFSERGFSHVVTTTKPAPAGAPKPEGETN